jgi:hypothetical protein
MPKHFKVTGLARVQRNLQKVLGDLPKAAAEALKAETEAVLAKAKARTPVDTGALRASGHVDKPKIAGKISVQLVFGGPSAPYADVVHEDLATAHDDGEAKFLERALVEAEAGMLKRIAAGVKKRIR